METHRTKHDTSVAVFDSGIGGLNLLKECSKALPDVTFYYLADNFNVPYGQKNKEEILTLVKQKFLCLAGVRLSAAVIACNTATANCISELRALFPFPVIGIQPAVKPAAQFGGRCLVLATPSTTKSQSFKDLLDRYKNEKTQFTVYPCEGLAEYVEKNALDLSAGIPRGMLPEMEVDSVVLGCTHYVFLKDAIKRAYNCAVFDGIAGTAAHLCDILGIGDHFKENSGIFDHYDENKPNITFLGGDNIKNARIYAKITSE